jgi:branched-chain amino acid transport system permease protein
MSVSDTAADTAADAAERSWLATSIYYTQQATIIGLIVLTIASAPYWPFANDYIIGIFIRALLFILLGQAWNIAAGIGGQPSLGHGVFFGVGAYGTALLFNDLNVTPWLGGLAAVAAAVAVALVISLTTVRLRSVHFALGTIVISLGFEQFTRYAVATGLPVRLAGDAPGLMQGRTPALFLWLSLGLATVFYLLTRRLLRCRFGLAMQAVRDDEAAAAAAGIDVRRTKLLGLLISAAMTGLAGTVYVQFYRTIDPSTAFGLLQSVQIQLPSLIGGLGTAAGPVIGGVLMALAGAGADTAAPPLAQWLAGHWPWLAHNMGVTSPGVNGLDVLVYGLMLLAVVMRAPDGLLRLFGGLGNGGAR